MNDQFSSMEANVLGELLGDFNSRSDRKRFLLPIGFSIFCLPFLLIGLAIMTKNGTDERLFGLFFVAIPLIIGGKSGYAILQNFLEGNWAVRVFKEGILLTRKGEDKMLRWYEIESVKRRNVMTYNFGEEDGIPLGTYCICTIQTRDGAKHTFSGFKVQELSDLINRHGKSL